MPAISRAITQTLSATPITKTSVRIIPNQGMLAATSPAMQAKAGPAINAERAPKRSSTAPPIGRPTNRPSPEAVTICAAVPGEISKDTANTGMVGTIIAHIPASRVLV